MVLDLFSGRARTPRALRGGADGSASGGSHSIGRSTSRSATDMPNISRPSRAEDRELLHNCIAQVQRSLKGHSNSPSTLHTLASYYTKVHPHIDGRPFCVNLSLATFLFHLQMARIGLPEVDLYVQLICNILGQIPLDEQLQHPFVRQVLRDHVFGLPSPTCKGGAHCVVLVPQQQYRAFAWLVTSLIDRKMIPMDIVYQFQDKLEHYCSAPSPIVANRSLALLVQTVGQTRVDEQVTALQYVLKTRPERVNMDFLLACYERLKRAVVNPANGPKFGRALAIHCSELFLRFRSPIRREYVERFLYPSLCHSDMADFLEIPATREHLIRELLAQCAPGMGTTNSFYLCLCAVLQSCFDNEIDGALETVTLINCLMPHAAYFMSTLAIDTRMSVSMFARIIITLSRGAGLAMTGREVPDEVAQTIRHQRTSVYNVLFVLRESVRSCSITASRRATDMLKALRIAVPKTSIEALGKLSSEAFDGLCDITIDPQLLCAELAMVLHQEHIEEAMESSVQYFRDVSMLCTFCGGQRSASLLCPVNGTVHVTGQTSVSRVLTTLAECAGMKVMEDGLIGYLRNPTTQMDSATHYLIYHILRNAGQHRNALFISLEPHIRGTLMALVSADRANSRGLVSSEQKADTLMLHVKIAVLLSPAMDPSYLESIIKVFAELKLRNNHDALALWCFANILIRSCKGNVELLPTDPLENQYCVGYPNCAPSSSTCADNAQLLLRLMDRAHTFSQETKKLVGCCVCKLIQDYNMQSPNIVSTLLSSHGFIPDELAALHDFALPVGAGSTFWMFFMQQMKSSAPARTALMTALAKSIARRFRVATPAEAISVSGLESTGQVFAVMVFEALKRSPTIARVVLHMVSNWTRQTNHTPGKFVCLVYICAQLINVVHYRGTGPSAVELTVETQQDRNQFQDCVSKAVKVLRSQEGRLMKLGPLAQQDNPVFYALVRRLHRRVRRTVAVVSGEQLPSEDEEDDNVYGGYDSEMMAGAPDEATRDNGDDRGWERDTHPSTDDLRSHAMVVEELHQVADDSVFDAAEDYPHRHGAADHGDDDAAYDDTTYTAVRDTTAYTDSTVGERDDLRARAAYRPTRSASRGVQTNTDATPLPHRPQAAPVGRSVDLLHPERSSTREKAVTAPVSRTVGTSPKTSDESSMTTAATPNRSGTLPAGASLRQTAPPRTTKDVGGPAWREPDLSDYVVEDITPIDKRDLPHLQATTPDGVILPSGMLLEYLRTHQGMDSLRDELLQVDHQWVEQHAASPWVSSMQHVAMEGRINNYDRPHNDNELAPHRTMLAEIRVRAEQEQRSMSSRQGAAVPPYGGDEVVDGEQHIAPMSGDPFLDEEAVGQKRSRTVLSAAPTPRGMNFFLQQNTTTVMSSALKEVRSLERQQPPSGQMPRPEPSLDAENRPPRGTPMVANLAAEGRPPVTPYGQMVIPSCFVEQKNDTAIRELHQVMGVHNPNDSRLSMAGKRRIAGSGAPAAEESTGSSVWWAEMSAAPMPTYATDPQYSMELF